VLQTVEGLLGQAQCHLVERHAVGLRGALHRHSERRPAVSDTGSITEHGDGSDDPGFGLG